MSRIPDYETQISLRTAVRLIGGPCTLEWNDDKQGWNIIPLPPIKATVFYGHSITKMWFNECAIIHDDMYKIT